MKPHPRIRKTIKWGGATLSILMLSLLLATGVFSSHWVQGGVRYQGIEFGYVCLEEIENSDAGLGSYGFHRRVTNPVARQFVPLIFDGTRGSAITVPVLGPTLLVIAVSGIGWVVSSRRWNTVPSDSCANCRYDRSGLSGDAVCPECGAGAVKEAQAR